MDLTEHHDLRGGSTPWDDGSYDTPASDHLPTTTVDVAICGAGITGAALAERLSAAGLSVAMLDRRPPGRGSTAASTALILWEADVPLTHLAKKIGEREAVRRWKAVHRASATLWHTIERCGIKSERTASPSLYIAGNILNPEALQTEAELRVRHGFPSAFLPADAAAERFGIAPRAAIISADSFELNPLQLTLALLAVARQRGVTISFPVDVTSLRDDSEGILLTSGQGELRARHVILATGYERSTFLPADFSLSASYAIATPSGKAPLWKENAMIWEASEGYLYTRSDRDGRIIAGGGDESFLDARSRDARIAEKANALAANLQNLVGAAIKPEECWAAIFGSSPDGLPAIGRASGYERLWLANGFGGNGITFAMLAAGLLTAELTGKPDPDFPCFDPYHFSTR